MTTLPIEIEVDDETADAFREATPETREQIALALAATLRSRLRSHAEPAEALLRTLDETSRQAQANGWTEDMNEALLRGDFDRDD